MTLNGVIALISRYFTEFGSFTDQLRHIDEDKPIISAKYRIPVEFDQNWHTKQSHGLFAIAKLLVKITLSMVLRGHFCPFVCLPVCLSIKRMHCDKKKKTCAHILIPHERSFILVFRHEEWLVGATTSTWNFGANWPSWSENADFQSIFARI